MKTVKNKIILHNSYFKIYNYYECYMIQLYYDYIHNPLKIQENFIYKEAVNRGVTFDKLDFNIDQVACRARIKNLYSTLFVNGIFLPFKEINNFRINRIDETFLSIFKYSVRLYFCNDRLYNSWCTKHSQYRQIRDGIAFCIKRRFNSSIQTNTKDMINRGISI